MVDGTYENLPLCTVLEGDLVLERLDGHRLPDLQALHTIKGSLTIRQSYALKTLQGLENLVEIHGDLHLINLPRLTTVEHLGSGGLQALYGDLHFVEVGIDECQASIFRAQIQTRGAASSDTFLGLIEHPSECQLPAAKERLANPPVDALPPFDEIRRGNLLEGLHPELADRARLLYALLESEGIEIVFISGHRPHDPNYRPDRNASWHNLGMAFDLNIVGRTYSVYDEDADTWARIGEVATGLGLIWGIRYNDIWHFEWHPGYHARIRDHEFSEFKRLAGNDLRNHHRVFSLFDVEEVGLEEPHCFGGCQTIPDDGLRYLLDSLR